jgi:TctA family transporter
MTQGREGDVDQRLLTLPDVPLPPMLAVRVQARARATFEGEGRGAGRLARIGTTTAVVSAVAIYLAWAIQFLSALGRT